MQQEIVPIRRRSDDDVMSILGATSLQLAAENIDQRNLIEQAQKSLADQKQLILELRKAVVQRGQTIHRLERKVAKRNRKSARQHQVLSNQRRALLMVVGVQLHDDPNIVVVDNSE